MPKGGARAGAGRLRHRITLDTEHARMLDVLYRYRRATQLGGSLLTKSAVVEDLICAAADALPIEIQVAGGLRRVPEL